MCKDYLKNSIGKKIEIPNNLICTVDKWNNFLYFIKSMTPPEVQFVLLLGLIEDVMGKADYSSFDNYLIKQMNNNSSYDKNQILKVKKEYNEQFGSNQKIREFFMNSELISIENQNKILDSFLISDDLSFLSKNLENVDYKKLINIFYELRSKFVHSCYGIPFWNEKNWSDYYIQSINFGKSKKNITHFIKNKLSNENLIKIIEEGLIKKIIFDIQNLSPK